MPLVALLIFSLFALKPEPSFARPAQQGLVESAILFCLGDNGLTQSADGTTCPTDEQPLFLLTAYGYGIILETIATVDENVVAIEELQVQVDEWVAPQDIQALENRVEALEEFDEGVFETFSEMFGALNGWVPQPD